jgi:hypothetical protein
MDADKVALLVLSRGSHSMILDEDFPIREVAGDGVRRGSANGEARCVMCNLQVQVKCDVGGVWQLVTVGVGGRKWGVMSAIGRAGVANSQWAMTGVDLLV